MAAAHIIISALPSHRVLETYSQEPALIDPRRAKVIELRFFGALSVEVLQVSA